MTDIFDQFEEKDTRETVINWRNQLKQIEDSYLEHRGVSHGIQKDAIQNGWDARRNQKGTGWKFQFELREGQEHNYLVMRDQGTAGLTGRVLEEEEYLQDLPPDERWGRFESLAFTKEEGSEALGSRGQGKFIFVVASQKDVILYDTLREDGTYRFGARAVKKTSSPVIHFDEREGRQMLQNVTRGTIPRLEDTGTRVIIPDPDDEVVESIESGEFSSYIGETWWEIIKKYDATIEIQSDPTNRHTVDLPEKFDLVEEDVGDTRYWTVEHTTIEGNIGIQKLHILHRDPSEVPDDIKGISIQRGGMKVDSVEPRYLPENIARGMYGYLTVDEEVEKELKRAENPEHYGFNYQYKVPRAIRNFVREEAKKFADEKLGWNRSEKAIQRQRQRNAERKALSRINDVTSEFEFDVPTTGLGSGGDKGTGGTGGGGPGEERINNLRINMPDIVLPNPGYRRVDHGESVRNITASVINDRDEPARVQLKLHMRLHEDVKKEFAEQEFSLDPGSTTDPVGPFEELFDEETYPDPGKYTVVARIVSLMDENKGDILDEKRRIFYLAEEPPADGGIFEDCEPVGYPEEFSDIYGQIRTGEEGGFVFEYNTEHPEYDSVADEENELATYLFRLMGMDLCRVDLERGTSAIFTDIDTEDPSQIAKTVFDTVGSFSAKYHSA